MAESSMKLPELELELFQHGDKFIIICRVSMCMISACYEANAIDVIWFDLLIEG